MALTKVSYGVITADASSIDLNIDANTLFVDSSANRVGIGTQTPSHKLSVSSGNSNDARITVRTGDSNAGAYFQSRSGTDGYYGLEFLHQGTEKWFIGGYGANRLGFWCGAKTTASNEKVSLTTAGNLGIGTTSPGSKLTVEGDIRQTSGDLLHSSGANWDIKHLTNDQNIVFHTSQSGSTTEKVRIKASGFVGIGTSSPLDLLHIKSSSTDARLVLDGHTDADAELKFAEAGTVKYTVGYDAGIDSFIIGTTNVDTNRRLVIDSAGSVGIGTQDPQYKLDVSGTSDVTMRIHRPSSGLAATDTCGIGFSQRGDSNVSSTDTRAGIFSSYNGDLFLAVEAGGNLNSNPMDHSALFIEGANGRVGIGTTSPSESLEVNLGDIKVQGGQNATTRGLIIAHTGQTGNLTMLRQDASGSRAILETTERNLRISAGSGGGTGTAETLDFFTNGVERAHFATDGNFIVGATSGSAEGGKIQVFGSKSYVAQIPQGNMTITDTATPADAGRGGGLNFAGTYLDNGTTTSYCSIEAYKEDSTSGNYGGSMVFKTRENGGQQTEVMRLTSTNNMGIATTSVERTLDVAGIMQAKAAHASNGGQLFLKSTDASDADDERYGKIKFINNSNATMASIEATSEGTGNNKGHLEFFTNDGTSTQAMRIRDNGTVQVFGALSKGSGSFEIPHPLESKKDSHLLRHSFIEGPQCDNIYRGTIELVNGTATVDLDAKFTMTNGTFVALNRNVQVFTTNESDWDNVKGSVVGNTLTITCQNSSSNATVSWLVVGERQDDNIKSSEITNNDGKLILEPEVYEGGT